MKESAFQAKVIKTIKAKWPGAIVLKNDANYKQGVPDLLILYKNTWATLECKDSATATHQPNQDYYVKTMDAMAFSAFIYPENCDDVLSSMGWHFNKETAYDSGHDRCEYCLARSGMGDGY